MIRILHIGDVHINKTFATKNRKLRNNLHRSLITSFNNAIQFCIHKKLDALMIAGDLFDSTHLALKDKQVIRDGFEKLNKHDIKVFYSSGNHDFTSYTSSVRNMSYPSNVYTFFDEKYQIYELLDYDTNEVYHIVGCGHSQKNENRNLIRNFPIASENKTIGLVHSMVESRLTIGDEGSYLPSDMQTLKSRKYEYFALGHIHQNGPIDKDERIYYSGVLQGLSSKELGPKGGNLVTLSKNCLEVEFVELAAMRWHSIDIEVDENIDTIDIMYECIITEIKRKCNSFQFQDLSLEVKLIGKTKLFHSLKDDKHVNDISDVVLEHLDLFDLKIRTKEIKSYYNKEDYIGKKSVLGKVLEETEKLRKNGELSIPEMLHQNDEEYVKKLLVDMDDMIMDYFLEDTNED